VARLWQIAALTLPPARTGKRFERLAASAQARQAPLLTLLDAVHQYAVPAPLGSYDSLVEYDRRRSIKEHLLHAAINTCLDTTMAVGTLEGALGQTGGAGSASPVARPEWGWTASA